MQVYEREKERGRERERRLCRGRVVVMPAEGWKAAAQVATPNTFALLEADTSSKAARGDGGCPLSSSLFLVRGLVASLEL